MLIACFPSAALILIKKYIWVRIWIAKCDLRPLDFAQKCPQNAGNDISENQISTEQKPAEQKPAGHCLTH